MPTRLPLNEQTRNKEINMIWPTLVHKRIMSWGSHDLCTSTISTTAQASTFSTRTYLEHNIVLSVRTQYMVPILHYRTNEPPSPLHDKSFTEIIPPKENYMPLNNPLKPVPYVPSDPDPDPSSLLSSLLDS